MDILSKKAMEITTLALDGLAARHNALSSNIANANTPNYQRIDVAFEGQLRRIIDTQDSKDQGTELKKPLEYTGFNPNIVLSGNPTQNGSLNNVNIEIEMAELAKNGMKYNALARIQAKAFQGFKEVIKGAR